MITFCPGKKQVDMNRLILLIMAGIMDLSTAIQGTLQMSLGIHSLGYAVADLPVIPVPDSNLLFLGGRGLGLDLILLWFTPSIEKQGPGNGPAVNKVPRFNMPLSYPFSTKPFSRHQ